MLQKVCYKTEASCKSLKNGADDVIRTHDPHITNVLLYRLSYIGTNQQLYVVECLSGNSGLLAAQIVLTKHRLRLT